MVERVQVAVISLEPWDAVWRRNQHLAAELVGQRLVSRLTFVEPATRAASTTSPSPLEGVDVITPALSIPKRTGGLRWAARQLMPRLATADVVWVNDPAFGRHCLSPGTPALYDVTDDWRTFSFPERILHRIIRAEDHLAGRARTVVCSEELRQRWRTRYGVDPSVVHNGIDATRWLNVPPRELAGNAPHVGYIGTLHAERLDVDLAMTIAGDSRVGTVHLVGPDCLDPASRSRLSGHPKIRLHGAVASAEVPSWTLAMDVLVCPHRVTPFTLSLDAIKAREYLASGRPIVATPTSGFQLISADSLTVTGADDFVAAVARARQHAPVPLAGLDQFSWAARARQFHRELLAAADRR